MRTRDELDRLAGAAPAVELSVDAAEENRILARILASDRPTQRRKARPAVLLVAVAVVVVAAAAVVGSLELGGHSAQPVAGRGRVAVKHATIKLAGYKFRLPAGYAASSACGPPPTATPGSPNTVVHSIRAAAAGDGGCLSVAILARSWAPPADAQAVSVGSYNGFLVSQNPQEALFVQIPVAQGDHYLVISAQGLTADQLVAIAESALPGSPGTTTACAKNCG